MAKRDHLLPCCLPVWQSIDTAPKDGTTVWVASDHVMRLAFWARGKRYEHRGSKGGGWRDFALAEASGAADLMFTPAYWMPVPTPPRKLDPPR